MSTQKLFSRSTMWSRLNTAILFAVMITPFSLCRAQQYVYTPSAFTYDPSQGNLIMDLKVINGEGPLWMDFTFAPSSTTSLISTVLLGVDSPVADLEPPTGGQWGGHIARFTVVPEPSGLLLTVGALTFISCFRRRLFTRIG